MLLSFFSLFSILILHLSYLFLSHINILHSFVDYIYSYAEALAGLRAINDVLALSDIKLTHLEPTLTDFNSVEKLNIAPFKFCIIKTADYIYSFSQKNESICILSARYSIENSIMLLSELSHYFRR